MAGLTHLPVGFHVFYPTYFLLLHLRPFPGTVHLHSHVRKLQVLHSKCLRIATNAPLYVGNRQIHEDLGIPFFAYHIRALTENFDSKLSDAWNPLVRQLGRHLRLPRAVLKSLTINRGGRMYIRPVEATPTRRPSRRTV
jgi:hypothetical protein